MKAEVFFKSKSKAIEKGIGRYVDRAAQRSSLEMERQIKIATPVKEGHLRRSITSRKTGFGKAEVFTNPLITVTKKGTKQGKAVNYAVYVEYGTKYMAPRGMFRKGAKKSEPRIKNIFREEAKKAYKSAKGL